MSRLPALPVDAELGFTTLLAMYTKRVQRAAFNKCLEKFASMPTDTKVFSAFVKITCEDDILCIIMDGLQGTHGVIFECTMVVWRGDCDLSKQSCPPELTYVLGRDREYEGYEIAVIHDRWNVQCVDVQIKAYASKPATSPLCLELNSARLRDDFGAWGGRVVLCTAGGELPAHRWVLASRSPVFAAMWKGDFMEAREDLLEDFKDVPKEVAEKFLEFLYLNHIEDMAGLEVELLTLADKYMVKELKRYCEVRLWAVEPLRAVELLEKASELPVVSGDLRKRFIRIILDNWPLVEISPQWTSFQQSHPLAAEVIIVSTCESS